jgi:Transcriptional regulator, AbiEi antitoxin
MTTSFRRPDVLTELLELQHGVLSAEQAAKVGLTRSAVRAHLVAHRWQQPHHGVYAVFTGPLPFRARLWAALLRVGETATASHVTAAYLAGLADEPGDLIHVTVQPTRRISSRVEGVVVHYAERLAMIRHRLGYPHEPGSRRRCLTWWPPRARWMRWQPG